MTSQQRGERPMGLRLILVSAVAGLGLSLPGADDFNAWALRAPDWMNAPLAGAGSEASPAGTPKVEPIEESDDLYAGIAYALNREAEGIAAVAVTAAPQTDQWAQALRLTREAAFAWANLLHGPAVVTIAR